jgi:PiT family inorganic phosphate transporter
LDTITLLCLLAVAIVLLFDYTNGFHDAANIIATVIASRAMGPIQAVIVVGSFEFLGPVLGGTAVADTIGHFVSLSDLPEHLALTILLSGLAGAIAWNLFTWRIGIPSSSSHALIGGLIGAVMLAVGSDHVMWGVHDLMHGRFDGVTKVILSLVVSPILGFLIGFVFHTVMRYALRAAQPGINRHLRLSQYVTAAGLAFSHGANDAQKSMGVLTLVLLLGGFIPKFKVPFWVILACASAMTLGILSGGWRIVRTLGFAIYKVRPLHALDSQLTSAGVILSASLLGAPVSTTHVVATSIMGIGASEHPRDVRWGKAREIVTAWLLTIPAAAVVGAIVYALIFTILQRGQT